MFEEKLTGLRELDYLVAQVSHLHYSRAHQLLDGLGLYRGQPPVLRILWEKEGITQTELAERMKVKPATVTKMLQRMEKAGFITRRPDPQDQRISRVYLSDSGRAVQNQVEAVFQKIAEETFADFAEEDTVLLRRCLLKIRENLAQAMGEKPCD